MQYIASSAVAYLIKRTFEFELWFSQQQPKNKSIIIKRIMSIEIHEHLGDSKKVSTQRAYDISELRFKNGTRIYFSFMEDEHRKLFLILMGGNKNGQSKDIKKAENVLSSWYETVKSAFTKRS